MKVAHFLNSTTRGAALVEYGLTVGLIAVLSIGTVLATGEEVESAFCTITETLSDKMGGSYSCATDVAGGNGSGTGDDAPPPYEPIDADILLTYQGDRARIMLEGVPNGTQVDWGDGTVEAASNGVNYHVFPSAGTWQVRIENGVTQIGSNCSYEPQNLVSVDSFGDSGSLTSLECAFFETASLVFVAPIPPSVTSLKDAFQDSTSNPSGLDVWNTAAVTDFNGVFDGASSFNQPIGSWNVSSGEDFGSMFNQASIFNQPLNAWDMSSAKKLRFMFSRADAFNQDLDTWKTPEATSMQFMFAFADDFDGNLSGWDVSNVTTMESMFDSTGSFTGKGMTDWDVSSVEDFEEMFSQADSFNGDLSGWTLNTSTPVTMKLMFDRATVFNQDLGDWDTSMVTDMSRMFASTAMDQNISQWCVENVNSSYGSFDSNTPSSWTESEKPNFSTGGPCAN